MRRALTPLVIPGRRAAREPGIQARAECLDSGFRAFGRAPE